MSSPPPLPPSAVALLACPVCGAGLAVDAAGLRCTVGHAFDRARQGHVSLLTPGTTPAAGDSAAMVADRVAFLAAGHYAGVTAALAEAVLAEAVLAEGAPRSVVDAGGGTGQHLAGVLDRGPELVGVLLDSSVPAARRAARAHARAMAVVCDSWGRWPLRSGSVDRVMVVFAPRNGAETARVLSPAGRLIVVTPGPDHLQELIGPLGLLTVDPDKAARLAATLGPHLSPVGHAEHRDVLALDRTAVRVLVGMGPHARHVDPAALALALAALPEPVAVTVSVQLGTWALPG